MHNCASALHLDFGVEQACSAAVRVTSSPPFSRVSPSSCSSSFPSSSYDASSLPEGRRLRVRLAVDPLSLLLLLRLHAVGTCTGAVGCAFPTAVTVLHVAHSTSSPLGICTARWKCKGAVGRVSTLRRCSVSIRLAVLCPRNLSTLSGVVPMVVFFKGCCLRLCGSWLNLVEKRI